MIAMHRDIPSRTSVLRMLAATMALCCTDVVTAGETITYFHDDLLGSPVMASDSNGLQAWKENYRPYGDQLVDAAGNQNNKIWFAGKPFDDSTGLSYMKARYYDPTLGRFMAVDPASFSLENLHSFNRYAYANNNPYRFVDPNGEWAISFNFIAVGVSFGQDERTGQFFRAVKVGMTGTGIAIEPGKNAPHSQEESCNCRAVKTHWEKGNIEAGLTFGPLSWQPFKYEGTTIVGEHIEGASEPHFYGIDGGGAQLDLLNLESILDENGNVNDKGKFGFELDLEANYEWGSTISWEAVRALFNMESLNEIERRNENTTKDAASGGER
jgi:RHS repeat-associated protein